MKRCWLRVGGALPSVALMLCVALVPTVVNAQFGGGFGGGGFGGGGLGGGGLGGGGLGGGGLGGGGFGGGAIGGEQGAGVVIDAQGVLRMRLVPDPGGLKAKRIVQEAMASLNPQLAKPSDLRKISLTRLERVVARHIAAGEPLPDEVKYLAGLLRVHNVFYYPDTHDLVVAGPAEGFAEDTAGRVRGLSTGWPVVELQDLVTALRAYPPSGGQTGVIGVSIDPTEEGLKNLQTFLKRANAQAVASNPRAFAETMRQQLGLQTVKVEGVSSTTHFAQVLVEADYRMKLIGIGLEQPPVDITTFIAAARPNALAGNALVRWYFVPDYQCVRVSEDGLAMQLEGWGVKLVGAQELVDQGGARRGSDAQSLASKRFCESFTQKYKDLALRVPVYAQLRNLIDLAVTAAFIQQQDYYQQASWDLGVLGDESRYSIETEVVPQHVESAVNAIVKGNALMTPIGGGVNIRPLQALTPENRMADSEGKVSASRSQVSLQNLPEDQWWWD